MSWPSAWAASRFKSRKVEIGGYEDEYEACFDRDWTDGLPVVPPTRVRVHRMLQGTRRDPNEVLGRMPPDYEPCTVEKVAINAVMAGCRPDYMPVVIAAVEAALEPPFSLHAVIATTMFVGPIVIVNGPVRKAIGMNSGVNALGQGNRANSTIGRALQLTIRNVGGGKPGGVDRATLGTPGKVGFCFAENEEDSCWEPLSVERGIAPGKSAVTLFAGAGVRGVVDQTSRTPESLARSFAACLAGMLHPKLFEGLDGIIVISPEHLRVFREAGWSKAALHVGIDGADDGARRRRADRRRRDDARRARERAGNDAAQVSRGRLLRRPCRRNSRIVLGDPRRLESQLQLPHHDQGSEELTMMTTTTLLDPTGEHEVVARKKPAKPITLDGITVGVLDIGKARGDVFLDRIAERLGERGIAVKRYAKPGPSRPAVIETRQRMLAETQVAVDRVSGLRVLHIVQSARFMQSRRQRYPGGDRFDDGLRAGRRRPEQGTRSRADDSLGAPPDPGSDR